MEEKLHTMCPLQVETFLLKNGVPPAAATLLKEQQIDGLSLLELTNDLLSAEFGKSMNLGYRMAIMRVVNKYGKARLDNCTKPAVEELCHSFQDMECMPLPESEASTSRSDVSASISSTIIRKRKISEDHAAAGKRKLQDSADTPIKVSHPLQAPQSIDVKSILLLKGGHEGEAILNHLQEEPFLTHNLRSNMLEILFLEVFKTQDGKFQFYPSKELKMALAQAIVNPETGFPQLADEFGGWSAYFDDSTSLGFIQTKLGWLRANKLTPSKRQRVVRTRGSQSSNSDGGECSSKDSPSPGDAEESLEEQGDLGEQLNIPANQTNYKRILEFMDRTRDIRRHWIKSTNPTATKIVYEFKHIISYKGELIEKEFASMFPKAKNYMTDSFNDAKASALHYVELASPAVYERSSSIKHDGVRALSCLIAEVTPSFGLRKGKGKQKKKEAEVSQYLEDNKALLMDMPSCSLLQIAPVGTDATSYDSVEVPQPAYSRDKPEYRPIHPYLLWLTNDQESGDLYLKIDRHVCVFLGKEDCLPTAVGILYKSHYVFNLEFHPYLYMFYCFLDLSYGIKPSCIPTTTVKSLKAAVESLTHKNRNRKEEENK